MYSNGKCAYHLLLSTSSRLLNSVSGLKSGKWNTTNLIWCSLSQFLLTIQNCEPIGLPVLMVKNPNKHGFENSLISKVCLSKVHVMQSRRKGCGNVYK